MFGGDRMGFSGKTGSLRIKRDSRERERVRISFLLSGRRRRREEKKVK